MTRLNILISLHRGYGLGDAVQMSAVLRHVVKYRPHWVIDFQAEAGRYCVGRGIVDNVFEFNHSPCPNKRYDAEVEITLFDRWYGFADRPNTRVSSCLHEHFGLEWDEECGQYQMNAADWVCRWAVDVVPRKSVAVHYQGDSDKARKDLTHEQVSDICSHIRELGRAPLMLGRHMPLGYDAEVNCAIISRCDAFVGIDSGPAKCASATNTPSLVVWTGHHPAPFHDPAPNTTHLVPYGYHSLEPVCNNHGVIGWFEAHYNVRQYDEDPTPEVKKWLSEVLT